MLDFVRFGIVVFGWSERVKKYSKKYIIMSRSSVFLFSHLEI